MLKDTDFEFPKRESKLDRVWVEWNNLTNDKKKRRYDSDDWLGDQEDLFSLGYNKVFTKWSNPSSRKDNGNDSNVGFEIVSYNSVTHQYIIKVSVNSFGIQAFAPSKPQNLQVVIENNTPKLTWDVNTEPDITSGGKYKIYRTTTSGGEPTSYSYVTTVNHPTTSWLDINYYVHGSGNKKLFYTISAVDNTNKESVKSEYDWLWWDQELQKKQYWTSSLNEEIIEYKLLNNYPNPFNPTTTITYQIPKDGFVNLVVYNTLGQVVAELVNKHQTSGKYSVQFNASTFRQAQGNASSATASNLPSGVYFYKIESGNFTKVSKMLLLR